MTTPAAILIALAGLSQREAAEFLSVRLDTVRSWACGRNPTPPGAIDEIRGLVAKQERAADEALAQIDCLAAEHGAADVVELGEPQSDDEARILGWPCAGAWRAMAARVVAGTDRPIRIVPRGSTMATSAALAR